jgi:hypothetical protein
MGVHHGLRNELFTYHSLREIDSADHTDHSKKLNPKELIITFLHLLQPY